MIIFVGLTDDCPTEEDIEILTHQGWRYGLMVFEDEGGNRFYFDGVTGLHEWADENYNIWALKGV